ncbi:MAG: hypothetical protein ACI9J3_004120 [Parvicellaceae bacterium]|jgi:hypothetical protein
MKMKWIISIVFTLTIFSACNSAPEIPENEIKKPEPIDINASYRKFLGQIGPEKTEALVLAKASLETFLNSNFDTLETFSSQLDAYLNYMCQSGVWYNENWVVDTNDCKQLYVSLEKSGLRKDWWYWGYEYGKTKLSGDYQNPREVPDSSFHWAFEGDFLTELYNHSKSDSLLNNYARVRLTEDYGLFDFGTLVCGAANTDIEKHVKNPFYLSCLIADVYMYQIIMYGQK